MKRFKRPSSAFSAAELRRELRRDEKRALNQRIKDLRRAASKAAKDRDERARAAKQACLAELKTRMAALNLTIREATDRIRLARQAKNDAKARACDIEAARVRAAEQAKVDLAKKERDVEIAWREEQERLQQAAHARGERTPRQDVRRETDQEVEWNLEAEDPTLVPIWKKMRRGMKQRPNMSRTEAFLEWVSKHEGEIAAMRARSVPSDEDYAADMERHYAQTG